MSELWLIYIDQLWKTEMNVREARKNILSKKTTGPEGLLVSCWIRVSNWRSKKSVISRLGKDEIKSWQKDHITKAVKSFKCIQLFTEDRKQQVEADWQSQLDFGVTGTHTSVSLHAQIRKKIQPVKPRATDFEEIRVSKFSWN